MSALFGHVGKRPGNEGSPEYRYAGAFTWRSTFLAASSRRAASPVSLSACASMFSILTIPGAACFQTVDSSAIALLTTAFFVLSVSSDSSAARRLAHADRETRFGTVDSQGGPGADRSQPAGT